MAAQETFHLGIAATYNRANNITTTVTVLSATSPEYAIDLFRNAVLYLSICGQMPRS